MIRRSLHTFAVSALPYVFFAGAIGFIGMMVLR